MGREMTKNRHKDVKKSALNVALPKRYLFTERELTGGRRASRLCAQQAPGASGDAPFHLCACLHMTAKGRELVLRLRTSFSEEESSQM